MKKFIEDHIKNDYFSICEVCQEVKGERKFYCAIGKPSREMTGPLEQGELIYDIASVSKIFTTTLILKLITLKKLSLTDKIDRILPVHMEGVTVLDLLNHSSGIHYWYPFYTEKDKEFYDVLEEVMALYPRLSRPVYSDLNFMLLGKIIEVVTESSLDSAMKTMVMDELGLMDTQYRHPVDMNRVVSSEYGNGIEETMIRKINKSFDAFRRKDIPIRGEVNDGNCFYYFNGVAGHAGIFSTVKDVMKLLDVYMDSNNHFINSDLKEKVFTRYDGDRAIGFQYGELYPGGGFGHTGFTGTYIYLDVKHQQKIAIFTNRLNSDCPKDINAFRQEIVKRLINE